MNGKPRKYGGKALYRPVSFDKELSMQIPTPRAVCGARDKSDAITDVETKEDE